ncbi:hypothetical protein MUB16_24265 [Priestia sp. OVL9]|nr:hypothetical protein [Priestia sp. OVL9]
MFDYTKLTSPDLQLQRNEVDMKRLLQQVIGEYEPILKEKALTFRLVLLVNRLY